MQQNALAAGAPHRTLLGELTELPIPLAGFKGRERKGIRNGNGTGEQIADILYGVSILADAMCCRVGQFMWIQRKLSSMSVSYTHLTLPTILRV